MRYPLNTLALNTVQNIFASSSTPAKIKATKEKQIISIILDSGSVLSIIDSSELYPHQVTPSTAIPITGINGSLLPIIGFTDMKFQIDGTEFEHRFVVVNGAPICYLLGLDFLLKYKAKMDFGLGIAKIGEISFPFYTQSNKSVLMPIEIIREERIHIDPGSENWRLPIYAAEHAILLPDSTLEIPIQTNRQASTCLPLTSANPYEMEIGEDVFFMEHGP